MKVDRLVTETLSMRLHRVPHLFRTGIQRSPEFAKKGLCQYGANIGAKCGHDCTYCSTGATLRAFKIFKQVGESPFERGYAIVDEITPERLAADAARIPMHRRGLVQLCTFSDAWAPEALSARLGRKCLAAILVQPGWSVRILTKSAAVEEDFDLISRYANRVLVGLSLTGTPEQEDRVRCVEPNASPISERLRVMQKAHALGLRTYGMLCPLLPEIGDTREQIQFMVDLLLQCGAEEIFAEPVNPRGKGLAYTCDALVGRGFSREAEAVGLIRRGQKWSRYAVNLLENLQFVLRQRQALHKLRYLLYPSNLTKTDLSWVNDHSEGVKPLGHSGYWQPTIWPEPPEALFK